MVVDSLIALLILSRLRQLSVCHAPVVDRSVEGFESQCGILSFQWEYPGRPPCQRTFPPALAESLCHSNLGKLEPVSAQSTPWDPIPVPHPQNWNSGQLWGLLKETFIREFTGEIYRKPWEYLKST